MFILLEGRFMRIRQLVLVAKDRDKVVKDLCDLFKIEVAFYDPGIIHFGLENAVIPVGDTFLEVVSPVQEDTTAGRYLERRKGDGGYMVIIQTDDFVKAKERVVSEGIQIVWNADRREEGIRAQGIHLHPKELGAILSIDSMEPTASWLWASTKWEEKIHTEVSIGLNGVCLQSKDPEDMMRKWEKPLGVEGIYKNNQFLIELKDSRVVFVEDSDGRGDGIESFEIDVKDKESVIKSAKDLGLYANNEVHVGGAKFILN